MQELVLILMILRMIILKGRRLTLLSFRVALSTNEIKDVLDEEISAAITKAVNDVEKEMDDHVNDNEQDKQNAVDDDASGTSIKFSIFNHI